MGATIGHSLVSASTRVNCLSVAMWRPGGTAAPGLKGIEIEFSGYRNPRFFGWMYYYRRLALAVREELMVHLLSALFLVGLVIVFLVDLGIITVVVGRIVSPRLLIVFVLCRICVDIYYTTSTAPNGSTAAIVELDGCTIS